MSTPSNTGSPTAWWNWFSDLRDDQRLERLQYCRQLEESLALCEANDDSKNIESFSAGLRMMKYFGWRGMLKDMPEEQSKVFVKSCARERHSVWACRAVSIGCGKELAAIKACFEEEGADVILAQAQTTYEPHQTGNSKDNVPCAELQAALGDCANKGAKELLTRKVQRSEANDRNGPTK